MIVPDPRHSLAPRFAERRLGPHRARWLATVDEAYACMERCIDAAAHSVRLEVYLLRAAGPGTWLLDALRRALARGVQVRLLYDEFGSEELDEAVFAPLRAAGARVTGFNPRPLLRHAFRDHRKLLACDGREAVLGGFNIGPEYAGDGVTRGWCDTGVWISGPVVSALERSFDAMFGLAPFTAQAVRQFRRSVRAAGRDRGAVGSAVQLLESGPGAPRSRLRAVLRRDLAGARQLAIASAYFLPSLVIRRLLYRVLARGGRVRVLLAGASDVPLAKLAAESLYRRLLRRRVRLYEYQPQVLHAKLLVMDDVVYVGSSNLDRRSLHINYELLLRLEWPELAADARAWFEGAVAHARPVRRAAWRRRGPWRRLLSRLAYLVLARLDPLVARRGARGLR